MFFVVWWKVGGVRKRSLRRIARLPLGFFCKRLFSVL